MEPVPVPSCPVPVGRAGVARSRLGVLLAVVPFVTLVAISCAPARAATSPGAAAGPSASTITMLDTLKFEPTSLTVPKGSTVTWRNGGQMAHTVTDDPAKASNKADAVLPPGAQPWESGNIAPGQTFSHRFDTPGTYEYFCIPHEAAGMKGTIIVTG